MEKMKVGRPKAKTPIRNKNIAFRVTEDELEEIQSFCIRHNTPYAEVMLMAVRKLDSTT